MKEHLRVLVAVLVMSLMFGCIGCQSKTEEKIKIGVLFPLSGNMALLGEEQFRGAELARQLINSKGGINGKQIEFIKADAPDATAAVAEADRLINKEGAKIIIGTYSSSLSYAASEVAERNGVIYYEVGAIADNITSRNFKYLFRAVPTASNFGITSARFLANGFAPKLGITPDKLRVAIVHEDSLYGTTVSQFAAEESKRLGMQVVAVEPYSAKAVDLSSVVMKLKAANPDAIIITSYAPDAVLFSRQAKELGLKVKALVGNGGGHSLKSFAEALGPDADGVFNTDYTQYEVNPQYAVGIKELVEAYKKAFNETPRSGHSLVAYHGTLVLGEILKKAASTNPEDVRKAALDIDLPDEGSVSGYGAKFAPPNAANAGQNLKAKTAVTQWQGGKQLTVWPEKAAVADMILPK